MMRILQLDLDLQLRKIACLQQIDLVSWMCLHACFALLKVTEVNIEKLPLTGILDDSFALCMARQQSLTSLLTLMVAYREELEYTVLSNLITVISNSCLDKVYVNHFLSPYSGFLIFCR